MATMYSLQLQVLRPCRHQRDSNWFQAHKVFQRSRVIEGQSCILSQGLSSSALRQDIRGLMLSKKKLKMPLHAIPNVHNVVTCQLGQPNHAILLTMKTAATVFNRACSALQETPLILKCAPAVGLMIFAVWGLGPLLQLIRNTIFRVCSKT